MQTSFRRKEWQLYIPGVLDSREIGRFARFSGEQADGESGLGFAFPPAETPVTLLRYKEFSEKSKPADNNLPEKAKGRLVYRKKIFRRPALSQTVFVDYMRKKNL